MDHPWTTYGHFIEGMEIISQLSQSFLPDILQRHELRLSLSFIPGKNIAWKSTRIFQTIFFTKATSIQKMIEIKRG